MSVNELNINGMTKRYAMKVIKGLLTIAIALGTLSAPAQARRMPIPDGR